MSYSTNPWTLRKIESQLTPLTEGRGCRWHRPVGASDRWAQVWAYKIREGLAIARRHPTLFPALRAVADLVRIEATSESLVEAYIIAAALPTAPVTAPQRAISFQDSIETPASLDHICASWDAAQPSTQPLHFPKTALTTDKLLDLARWLAAKTPPWMVLYMNRTTSLTLALDDPNIPAEAKVQVVSL